MYNKKILVVDDDEGILQMMKTVIKRAGLEPVCCKSVLDGLDYLSTGPTPALVVTGFKFHQTDFKKIMLEIERPDLNPPKRELTGADVIEAVRVRCDAPVILITGGGIGDEVKSTCEADDYFAKPFDLNKITDVIVGFVSNETVVAA